MKVKNIDIANAVLSLLEAGKSPKVVSRSLAGYLAQEHRTKDLDSILRSLTIKRENKGIKEITVSGINPLSPKTRDLIEKMFKTSSTKKVIINQRIDEELIGGIMIESNEQRLDLSIRSKVNKLRNAGGSV